MSASMTWVLWLAAPAGATALAALWSWVRVRRARPPRTPRTTADAMQAHRNYLDAIVTPARSADRGREPAPDRAHSSPD